VTRSGCDQMHGPGNQLTCAPASAHRPLPARSPFSQSCGCSEYRTGSIASTVGPAVITTFLPSSCRLSKAVGVACHDLSSGSSSRPGPTSPQACSPCIGANNLNAARRASGFLAWRHAPTFADSWPVRQRQARGSQVQPLSLGRRLALCQPRDDIGGCGRNDHQICPARQLDVAHARFSGLIEEFCVHVGSPDNACMVRGVMNSRCALERAQRARRPPAFSADEPAPRLYRRRCHPEIATRMWRWFNWPIGPSSPKAFEARTLAFAGVFAHLMSDHSWPRLRPQSPSGIKRALCRSRRGFPCHVSVRLRVSGPQPVTMFRTPRTAPSGGSCPTCTTIAFWVESEKRFVSLRVSSKGMRIIDKRGIDSVLEELARARRESLRIELMREKIRMNSTAGTGHFYTTDKNKRTMPDKLEMKKYDPVARKHVVYKEGRSSNGFSHCVIPKPRPCTGVFFLRLLLMQAQVCSPQSSNI